MLGYRRYLTDSGKLELGRYRRYLKTPNAAYARLMTLLSKPWFWGILPHNCLVFVEEILQAGGATNFGLFSNCPVLQKNQDQWEKMVYDMRRKANEMAIGSTCWAARPSDDRRRATPVRGRPRR
jgi:hypothetical protein